MTPDDPRHGTKEGYNRGGCREQCCRHAQMVSVKRHRLGLDDSLVDSLGTVRRLQALSAIGYTNTQIAGMLDKSAQWFTNRLRYPKIRKSTAVAVADVYERTCMKLPPETVASRRARIRSARKGWVPPLAWDNIDDPNETPDTSRGDKATVDEVKVQRVLDGLRQDCTTAERLQVLDRWEGSHKELGRITGWNIQRMLNSVGRAA